MLPDYEIWLDNHISPIIAKWLKDDLNIEVKSSYVLKLYELTDLKIYEKARKYGNVILVSKDSDLPEIISVNGSPPKLIYLKAGNCDNRILFSLLKLLLSEITSKKYFNPLDLLLGLHFNFYL